MRRLPVEFSYKSQWLTFVNAMLFVWLFVFFFGMLLNFFALQKPRDGFLFMLIFAYSMYALYYINIFHSLEISKDKILINLNRKTQTLNLKNASLHVKLRGSILHTKILVFKNLQTNKKLYEINLDFFTKEDKKALFELLAQISNRDINEFENNYKFEPFVKTYPNDSKNA